MRHDRPVLNVERRFLAEGVFLDQRIRRVVPPDPGRRHSLAVARPVDLELPPGDVDRVAFEAVAPDHRPRRRKLPATAVQFFLSDYFER